MLSKATRNRSLTMDKYDRMLLSALLEDGRASYAQLARTVNLSAPPWPNAWPSLRPAE